VHVNPAFVRANEVHRLCGNPAKLQACTGPMLDADLGNTLHWMLELT
jgi:GDP-D-mannose dehydratase